MSSTSTIRIPGYGLEPPTQESIVTAFAAHLGKAQAEALWLRSYAELELNPYIAGEAGVRRVLLHIAAQGGIVGVCAYGQHVRVVSYAALLKRSDLIDRSQP